MKNKFIINQIIPIDIFPQTRYCEIIVELVAKPKYYISLGSTCASAYQSQKYGVKGPSLPFDWIKSNNWSSVLEIFQDKFHQFTDTNKLKFVKQSNKFPIVNDIFISENNDISYIYHHETYGVDFFHDFKEPIENNFDITIGFIDKYNRRIKRLYDILSNNDNEIIFIRDEHKYSVNPDQIKRFIDIIKEINPNMNYRIIVIIFNHKMKLIDLSLYDKIDNLHIIIDNSKLLKGESSWQRDNFDWSLIFKKY